MLILLLACASSFECGTIGRGDDPTCCVPSMWNLASPPSGVAGETAAEGTKEPPMNSRQRRLVRRAEDRDRAAEMAAYMGDDESTFPRPARHVQALLDRAPGHRRPYSRRRPRPPAGFAGGLRDPAAYGLRCHECGRPAHGVEHRGPPVCAEHNTDIPF